MEAREDLFNYQGTWLREEDGDAKEGWSLEVVLNKYIEIVNPGSGKHDGVARRALITSKAE